MFSGGIGSWAAAKRVAQQHGTDDLFLLFTDTKIEDEDLYRFLPEAAANVGGALVWLADGRTPWDVFEDVRFLGNTRVAPCSHILKQQVARRWVAENCHPEDSVLYVGIDWTESHRLEGARTGWSPYAVEAPLCEAPFVTKADLLVELEASGIAAPRLYGMGFAHNNCGGGCVRSGQAQFALLYERLPETFAAWESGEERIRSFLDKDVAILRDRTGGETRPLPLAEFKKRIAPKDYDEFEFGGCGCFLDESFSHAESAFPQIPDQEPHECYVHPEGCIKRHSLGRCPGDHYDSIPNYESQS